MKRNILLLLVALALAAFGLAACGDDDDDDGDAADTVPTEQPAPDTGDTDGDTAGGGATVSFTADPGGQLAFEEDSAEAPAGSVTIELTNESAVPHDVRIEDPSGADIGGTDVIMEDTATAEVDLEAGDHTFYCSVPGHREAGMEGTLTVE